MTAEEALTTILDALQGDPAAWTREHAARVRAAARMVSSSGLEVELARACVKEALHRELVMLRARRALLMIQLGALPPRRLH